jgi:hypothetical protein
VFVLGVSPKQESIHEAESSIIAVTGTMVMSHLFPMPHNDDLG